MKTLGFAFLILLLFLKVFPNFYEEQYWEQVMDKVFSEKEETSEFDLSVNGVDELCQEAWEDYGWEAIILR